MFTRRKVQTKANKRAPLEPAAAQLKKPKLETVPHDQKSILAPQNLPKTAENLIPASDLKTVKKHPSDIVQEFVGDEKSSKEPNDGSQKATVRASIRIDYQNNLCTQFVKTGRCRYGDSCQFLHERETVASKPGVSTKWSNRNKESQPNLKIGCSICQAPHIAEPVKPPCQHICCQHCFLQASRERQKCRICQKPMQGSAENCRQEAK